MSGLAVGHDIVHYWFEDGKEQLYNGCLQLLKKNKYSVLYWEEHQTTDDAIEYKITKHELVINYCMGDLLVS